MQQTVEVVERISTAMSESWVAWVLFVLLVLQAVNRFFVPDMAVVLRGLFSRSQRTYVDASWQSAVLEWLYRMGVIALAVYLCVFGNAPCSILDYLWVLCMMAGVLLMQYGIARLVGVVFLGARQMEGAFEYRAYICNVVSALLWPLLLVARLCGSQTALVVCVIALSLLALLLIWKGLQMFCKNLRSIFYILLYVATIEVLPLIVGVYVIKQVLG